MFRSNRRQFLGMAGAAVGGAVLFDSPILAVSETLMQNRNPRIVPPGKGRAVWWLGAEDRLTFMATKQDTGGAYSFWLDEPPARVGPPRHIHSLEEEAFYVLEGEALFQAGDQSFNAKAGCFIGLPKGIPHSWTVGANRGSLLTLVAPGGNEGFFFDLGVPISQPPPSRDQMPEIIRINQIAAKYGVTYLGPSNQPSWGTLRIAAGRVPVLLKPDEGKCFSSLGTNLVLKAVGQQTDKQYTFAEFILPSGGTVPFHRHPKYEEGVYVRDGEVSVRIGEETRQTGPGSFVIVPKGVPHGFRNRSEKPARLLSLTTPHGLEDYYLTAYHPVKDASVPPRVASAEDFRRLQSVGQRFGVEVMAAPGTGN